MSYHRDLINLYIDNNSIIDEDILKDSLSYEITLFEKTILEKVNAYLSDYNHHKNHNFSFEHETYINSLNMLNERKNFLIKFLNSYERSKDKNKTIQENKENLKIIFS